MRRRHEWGLLATVACAACGLLAAPAQASFHDIKIREVFLGTVANSFDDTYVVLQAFTGGQNVLGGHTLFADNLFGTNPISCTFPNGYSAPNSSNQMTVLIGDTASPVTPDYECGDLSNPIGDGGNGGAVCWGTDQPSPLDCVTWGNYTGPALGSPTGTPAPVIPVGMAIRRTITPNCPTLLEAADDTDDSATDFSLATSNPRNNASPITEMACATGGDGTGGGGGGTGATSDTTDPTTKIKKVVVFSELRKAVVRFKGSDDQAGTIRFQCKLDRRKFRKCKSPKTYRHLKFGRHKVKVRAIDAAGNKDTSPAKRSFRLVPPGQGA